MTNMIILAAIILALIFTSAPVVAAFGLAAFIYTFIFTDLPALQMVDMMFNGLNSYPLVAIPFFILAANIMRSGGISDQLIDIAKLAVGRLPGGLAMAAVLACAMFASISGSSAATVLAIGSVILPAMMAEKYPKEFATGIVATSGSLGMLIPPSVSLIVMGIAANLSVGDLFIGGFGPGILGAIFMMLIVCGISVVKGYGHQGEKEAADFSVIVKGTLSLLMPIGVLGGIYTGFFTPTEAAIVAVFYALAVSTLVYRRINTAKLWQIILDSGKTSAMIMIIIAAGTLLSFVINLERFPRIATEALINAELTKVGYLIAVNLLLIVVGLFMETNSAIIILAPILVPIAVELGVNPIHFAIIMVLNLEIGLMTPPMGINLFVASGLTGLGVLKIARAVLPTLAGLLITLILVTFIPEITLFLVELSK